MTRSFGKYLLAGFFAVVSIGCEPRPVVVDPDDGDTTIIEDDADVEIVPNGTTTQPATGVDVQVGDGGVDVNVNPPQPDAGASGTNSGASQNNSTTDPQQ
jgi:hypothetical protein